MKKNAFVLLVSIIVSFFSLHALAVGDTDFGWKAQKDANGKVIGLTNVGEQGGKLALTCDTKTQRLKLSYVLNKTPYDMYVFRKFGVVDINNSSTAGKFLVGTDTTTQAAVYQNVLNAQQAFAIARFEIGSKAKWDTAVNSKSPNPPEIRQEGEENFLAGEGWRPLLKTLADSCPVNTKDNAPIF